MSAVVDVFFFCFLKVKMENKLPSLFRLLNGMRFYGEGCKVTRSIYKFPNTYWIIKQ